MTFSSVEQRMAWSYLEMLPAFVPDEEANICMAEQERFYALIRGLYQLAFDEPLLFVTSLHADDAYPSRYKKAYDKPQLILDMRKFTKAVDALLLNMFLIGKCSDVVFNKRQQAILTRLGVRDIANLPAAWVWMSNREGASLSAFSHCLFRNDYPYTSEVYARLLGEQAFRALEGWMLSRGYKRFDISDVTASDCKLSLTIANPEWSNDRPSGGFEYKIRHTGIAAQFDDYVRTPAAVGLCIPYGMKPYLERFDAMDTNLQRFVAERTKKCDNCRYCVQTDKTGTRPLAYMPITFEDNRYHLCPIFPGYNYCWTSIDEDLVDQLIRMLSFMDQLAPMKDAASK